MYLTDKQRRAVEKYAPVYLEAERATGVPAALLAGIHYRETSLADNAGRVGGIMQFDPPLSPASVRYFGQRFGIPDLTDPETDPRTAIICAAGFLQLKRERAGLPLLTPGAALEACADAAWRYNGTAYGSSMKSPYVANDPQNGVSLWIRGTVPDANNPALRVRIDHIDKRPGVLAIMAEAAPLILRPGHIESKAAPVLFQLANGAFAPMQGNKTVYMGVTVRRDTNGVVFLEGKANL